MDLVPAAWLLDHIDDPDLRLADVRWYLLEPDRGRAEYATGHLPGAVFVDLATVLSDPVGSGPGRHPLPSPARFVAELGALGFGSGHRIVAYDEGGGLNAARLWWMLDQLGHPRPAVLDGGVAAWQAAGGALTATVPSWPPAELRLGDRWRETIDRDELRARLGRVVLLDARAAARYRGETEPIDPVAGHIPTARSLPSTDLLAPDGSLLAADELRARFAAVGADGDQSVVVSCGSGITAAHLALAMRSLGLPDPILYEGSYSDWSRSGLPVATGPEPGSADLAR